MREKMKTLKRSGGRRGLNDELNNKGERLFKDGTDPIPDKVPVSQQIERESKIFVSRTKTGRQLRTLTQKATPKSVCEHQGTGLR